MTGLTPGALFNFRVSAENPAGISSPAELPVAVELKGQKGKTLFGMLLAQCFFKKKRINFSAIDQACFSEVICFSFYISFSFSFLSRINFACMLFICKL